MTCPEVYDIIMCKTSKVTVYRGLIYSSSLCVSGAEMSHATSESDCRVIVDTAAVMSQAG